MIWHEALILTDAGNANREEEDFTFWVFFS